MPRLILFVLTFLVLSVGSVSAYEHGLLYGKMLSDYPTSKWNGSKSIDLQNITDDNPSTSARISGGVSYQFSSPVDLTGFYLKASGTQLTYSKVSFYRQDGTLIHEFSVPDVNGKLTNVELADVFLIVYLNENNFYNYIADFEVYGDTTPAQNPMSVKVTAESSTSIRLSWVDPPESDFQKVEIYRDDQLIGEVEKGTQFFVDTGLTPSTSYTYKLVSVDENGNRSSGITITGRTYDEGADLTPPQEISNIKTEVYNDRIKITWTNPPDLDFLEVRIFKDGQLVAVAITPATQFTDYDLEEHTTYTYLFRTVDTSGNVSPGVSITETTKGKPPQVTGLHAEPNHQQVTLSFFRSSDPEVTGYNIYQDGAKIATTTDTTYTVTGLTNGQTYTFQVSAVNQWGESVLSEPVSATPNVQQIKNLRVIERSTKKLLFGWDYDPVAEKYIAEITVKHTLTASTTEPGTPSPTETITMETTENQIEVTNNIMPGDEVSIAVSAFNAEIGKYGTATLNTTVPITDIPTANDVISSSFSLASSFWPFALLGLVLLLTPYLFSTMRQAAGKRSQLEIDSPARLSRATNREIRLKLRGK